MARKSEKKGPNKKITIVVLLIVVLFEVVCGISCFHLENHQLYCLFVSILMFLYHILIRFTTPRLLAKLKKKYNPDNFLFRPKRFEKSLYKSINIKKWKANLITYEPETFLLKYHTPEEILQTMCYSEMVHIILTALSVLFIFFGFIFGNLWAFIVLGCISTIWELRFVIVQRYNRPRIQRIAALKKRGASLETNGTAADC